MIRRQYFHDWIESLINDEPKLRYLFLLWMDELYRHNTLLSIQNKR